MSALKIRLKNGTREIELEGPKEDVAEFLEKWWTPEAQSNEDEDTTIVRDSSSHNSKRTKKRKTSRESSGGIAADKPSDPDRDPNKIANDVKQDAKFSVIEQRIILAPGDIYNKVAFICWFVGRPLTSGDIYRALVALSIKIDLPRVSNILKKNMSNFLTSSKRISGGKPAEYTLSAKAKSDFETWLSSSAK